MQELTEKPLPLRCSNCREKAVRRVTVPYSIEIEHDGRLHLVTLSDLELLQCSTCGERVIDSAADVRINDALRRQLQLLFPDEIRRRREALQLTEQEMADQLNVDVAVLARWESGGQIQRRDQDRMLRWFFEIPAIRLTFSPSIVNGAGNTTSAPLEETTP